MTAMYLTGGQGACMFSCMVADGLFDGVSREEKLALRRAQAAERAFRTSKGYERKTLADRLRDMLKMQ